MSDPTSTSPNVDLDQRKIRFALMVLRLAMGAFLLVWSVDKLISPWVFLFH